MRHQNAVVYVLVVTAGLMLTSSFGLIFTQHISIIHVMTSSDSVAIQMFIQNIMHLQGFSGAVMHWNGILVNIL